MVDWCRRKIHFDPLDETSQPIELLLAVDRDGAGTLGAQIEEGVRRAIRDGALQPGSRVPSTRDLARQLGVSRRVAVDAYAQLAGRGVARAAPGRPPTRGRRGRRPRGHRPRAAGAAPRARYDFRPAAPDVSTFPRAAWLRAVRDALGAMTDADLDYGDPRGVETLRAGLAGYLGRVRGVVAHPDRILVTCGYSQGLGLVCRALAERGARRIALEDPSNPEQGEIARRAGLEAIGIGVDDEGLDVDALAATRPTRSSSRPPTSTRPASSLGARRTALIAWLRARDAVAIEDDYDAEYRYDRAAVGALQGLEPDRVVYAGSASKTLAPALRLGWLVLPPRSLGAVSAEKCSPTAARPHRPARVRRLPRARRARPPPAAHAPQYRARRDALVAALAERCRRPRSKGSPRGCTSRSASPTGSTRRPRSRRRRGGESP
jgi:GntR family transcriptional regulator/MocR family aminotransferase